MRLRICKIAPKSCPPLLLPFLYGFIERQCKGKVNFNINQVCFNYLTRFNHMNLGRLKSAIDTSGLTKKEIAMKSGISPQALHGILENNADPKVSNLESIANVVGIKMSVLFDESNVEINENKHSFNSNADEIIKELSSIIKSQEARIAQLTDKLLGL